MVKPVSSFASRAVARRMSPSPMTAASRARSTRLVPATRARTGSGPSSPSATNTSDFTIWPSSAPTAVAASWAVWVDSSKVRISMVTPLRAAASRTRRTAGWSSGSGTAGSLASAAGGPANAPVRPSRLATRSLPHRRAGGSIATMRALILADGDAPARERLDAAWPGWDRDIGLVIAADGGARHAPALAVRIDRWVGDGDSIAPADLARLEADGVPIERARPDKDESDTELAVRMAARGAPDGIVILGALGGARLDHAVANLGLPTLASVAGIPVVLLSDSARVGWILAPHSRRPAGDLDPGRATGWHRVAAAARDGGGGRHDPRPRLPIGGRAAAGRHDARTLERHRGGGRLGRAPVGRPARDRSACYARRMTDPTVGDRAPEIALPDDTGTVHRLADQHGRWTIVYFYPTDDTPGCTTEACEFRDMSETIHERGADVWGISPQGQASKRAFREKFGLPFALLADEGHHVADAYGTWVEKKNYGKTYWGTARTDLPRRSRWAGRPGLAEGQAGGPCGRGPRRARRVAGVRRRVKVGSSAGHARDFARGGRRAKPRPQSVLPGTGRRNTDSMGIPDVPDA